MNDYMLMYKKMDNLEVIDYSDLDFAGCNDSHKSTSGYIFMFADRVVPWRSVKHTLIATSTMEVQFVSCFETTSYSVWMRSFIYGLKIIDSISRPLRIFCINSATIILAKNNKSGSRIKHNGVKYLPIREGVKDKVVIEHMYAKLILDDPLTKRHAIIQVQGSCRLYGPWSFSLISLYEIMLILNENLFQLIFLILFYANIFIREISIKFGPRINIRLIHLA